MGVLVNPLQYTGLSAPANNEGYDDLDPEVDALLIEASQRVERELIASTEESGSCSVKENNENDYSCRKLSRFGPFQSDDDVKQVKEDFEKQQLGSESLETVSYIQNG